MAVTDTERGRDAYLRSAWTDAEAAFATADAAAPLAPADLDRWATAAYMLGREDDYLARLERAHDGCLAGEDPFAAARCAFWIGVTLLLRGEHGPAGGWLARAQRLVGTADCVERAYLRVPDMFRQEMTGDYAGAALSAASIAADAERHGDRDLFTLALHNQGCDLVLAGRVTEGLRLLDEAMLGVVAGETSPIPSGHVYCGVITGCEAACDVARAQQWTDALSRWCERQPDMLAFTGRCMVQRAELMQLRGAWDAALAEVRRAADRCERAGDGENAAIAAYRRGEIHRLRGERANAEEAYRAAAAGGCEPQPGLALLRLATGDVGAAEAMLRRALEETVELHRRARLLPAALDVQLASGHADAAAACADELEAIAGRLGTDLVAARAAQARGQIALEYGQPGPALGALRRAGALWRALDAPYDGARVRELVGRACRTMGDEETAVSELEAAADRFRELGATIDAARVDALLGTRRVAANHGLSARELEVLRLVARGATNRAIAGELVLSERTVDRHVSNILAKLRVGSRAGATAYAYEHRLL